MLVVGWKCVFFGNVMDVEVDLVVCVLILFELCESVGLDKDVVLFGMGSYFELWDKKIYVVQEVEVLVGLMLDVLKDFSF